MGRIVFRVPYFKIKSKRFDRTLCKTYQVTIQYPHNYTTNPTNTINCFISALKVPVYMNQKLFTIILEAVQNVF